MNRKPHQYVILGVNAILIALAAVAALGLYYANSTAASINRVLLEDSLTEIAAGPGSRVINILLVGSDSAANLDDADPIRNGRQGQRLGDVIIVAHIDERSGDLALLSIPRDTWVEIPGLNRSNRINKAFEAGGPKMLVDTIEANFNVPIHHFVNVDFAGFKGLVEAVGDVTIHFDTPARDFNTTVDPPRSQTGFEMLATGCRALDPDQSLAYVRSRFYQVQNSSGEWVTDPTSDLGRIRRQQDFLRQLMNRAIELGGRNPLVMNDLVSTGLDHVVVDEALTPAVIRDLAALYSSFEPGQLQTYSLPVANARQGSRQVLALQPADASPILSLFSGQGFSGPTTVGLEVLTADGILSPQLEGILGSAGFDFTIDTSTSLKRSDDPNRFVVRHGPDGLAAAQLVASALPGGSDLVQRNGIIGRNVQIIEPTQLAVDEASTTATPAGQTSAAAPPAVLPTPDLAPASPTIAPPAGPDSSICG